MFLIWLVLALAPKATVTPGLGEGFWHTRGSQLLDSADRPVRIAMVDTGNTVIVIEHNLEVIKTADWIIDLGPEGGTGGGRSVAQGSPEEVAKTPGSHTGEYLSRMLK